MTARFSPDRSGVGEMLRSAEMEVEMRRRATVGAYYAAAIAPFDPHSRDGSHYKTSFRVTSGRRGGFRNDRAFGRLSNVDPAALWIELGSKHITRRRVLGKALDVMKAG